MPEFPRVPAVFTVKLRKIGNSYVVSMPRPAVDGLEWKLGDTLKLIVADNTVSITRKPMPR